MEKLTVSKNNKYLMQGEKPFFWLGDTGWLIFSKLTEEQAFLYLKNRKDKGFNVIQAVLVYSLPDLNDINKMCVPETDVYKQEYWEHCDKIIKAAEKLGLYMALLPSWGSLVKKGAINIENAEKYGSFLAERYSSYSNIIWVLGGDINAEGYEKIYHTLGTALKIKTPDKLVTFHPFGRCSSSIWFNNAVWLDFNMFQSGHRRYDQVALGKWDDNKNNEFFGEDNWRYVLRDHSKETIKPTLDAEPSYEWILQGLHDKTQPYWKAKDVRRYAYWSVFAGACGHTYGDNSVMQFFGANGETEGSYGAIDKWETALHHEGSGQMFYLKQLMESVNFTEGTPRDDLIVGGQREQYDRIAVFAGSNFIFAYSYTGKQFALDLSEYENMQIWWFSPSNGTYSYTGTAGGKIYTPSMPSLYSYDTDLVLVLKSNNNYK